jgi:predicted flavoprotein YhiN
MEAMLLWSASGGSWTPEGAERGAGCDFGKMVGAQKILGSGKTRCNMTTPRNWNLYCHVRPNGRFCTARFHAFRSERLAFLIGTAREQSGAGRQIFPFPRRPRRGGGFSKIPDGAYASAASPSRVTSVAIRPDSLFVVETRAAATWLVVILAAGGASCRYRLRSDGLCLERRAGAHLRQKLSRRWFR